MRTTSWTCFFTTGPCAAWWRWTSKLARFVAADKGQMDLYLSWLKRHEWREHENEPVGLILCTSKKRQHVELLLADGPHKMQVSEYLTKLPDKKVLEERLKLYGRMLEEQENWKTNPHDRQTQID